MGQRWFLTLEIVIPVLEDVAQCPSLVSSEREREREREKAREGKRKRQRERESCGSKRKPVADHLNPCAVCLSGSLPLKEEWRGWSEGGEECCRGQAWLGTRCPPSGGGMSR